ncbi:MAG: LLM class flavin-dependent oxidoreductase [Pseudomonadota bacterium]
MKISIGVRWDGNEDFTEQATYVREAELLGVDSVWTVEGWGTDAVTPLAYLAAKTERIKLGTSIMQVSARVPSMTAMTAMTLAALSGNRFILGLGVSGPQLVEGFHGQTFHAPLTRLQETVELIRRACAGEKLSFEGKHHQLPLPGGEGRALRLSQRPNPNIPIFLATLGTKSLEYTGAAADGWLGTSFVPEQAGACFDSIRRGAESVGRSLTDLTLQVGAAEIEFGDDLEAMIDSRRMGRAFTLGAMGSKKTNFYTDAYSRAGWAEAAQTVQKLWLDGNRKEAAAQVPADMITQTNLLGDESAMLDRLRVYRDAGVDTLKVQPIADTLEERLNILGRLLDLLKRLEQ